MPRKTRMYLPGIPAHVVQRGHNRDACFFDTRDYQFYLAQLGVGLRRYGVALHAYVLMTYFLSCMRYIELNPVVAGMVQAPEQYRWTSYRTHAWGDHDALLTEHPIYRRLGDTPQARQHAYRELFRAHVDERDIHDIRRCAAFNHPLGNERFRKQIEAITGRRVGYAARGRPRRNRGARR